MAKKRSIGPTGLTLHVYQVGFGDCFLLTWHYASGDRQILIDFGSTGLPATAPANQLTLIAEDIAKSCGHKLDAVVLTHRHKDHMAGFATTSKGTGPGDVIRSLTPGLVIQPWTEDPKAKPAATEPTSTPKKDNFQLIASLRAQRIVIQNVVDEANALAATGGGTHDGALQAVTNEGMEGILNPSAVENLETMAPPEKHRYVFHGSASGLDALLPGVAVTVLGPPTLKQTDTIKKESASNSAEFWMLQALDVEFWEMQARNATFISSPNPVQRVHRQPQLFPRARVIRGALPFAARWFVPRIRAARAGELLGIVRILDKVMNNTSVILLFEVGTSKFLFPGDAQIENWDFTLQKADLMKRLADVTFYKVGHHGSRNATPKSLWTNFQKRAKTPTSSRLQTAVSTMAGKFGQAGKHTEVPRTTLITALKEETNFFSTQEIVKAGTLKKTFEFTF